MTSLGISLSCLLIYKPLKVSGGVYSNVWEVASVALSFEGNRNLGECDTKVQRSMALSFVSCLPYKIVPV